MTRTRAVRECLIMIAIILASYHAGRSIMHSISRQVFLHRQAVALRSGHQQAEQVNRELRAGLTSYQSLPGIERLARERLNLTGPGEILVRIGK